MSFCNFFFNCGLTFLFKYNSSVLVPICPMASNVSGNSASSDCDSAKVVAQKRWALLKICIFNNVVERLLLPLLVN